MENIDYKAILNGYKNLILAHVKEEGGIYPHITVFGAKKVTVDPKKPRSMFHIEIPNFDKMEFTKEQFLDSILVTVFDKIKEEIDIDALAFVSEAHLRKAPLDFDFNQEDFQTLPVSKEILMFKTELPGREEMFIYNVVRKGTVINDKGELVEDIDLELETELEDAASVTAGNFHDLWGKYVIGNKPGTDS